MTRLSFAAMAALMLSWLLAGCSAEYKLTPHYSKVAQGRIEYYQYGQGSPIVLIPGYATDVSSWSKIFLKTLAQHHRLFIINNRLVGGSRVYSTDYKSSDLADDVSELIQNLHLKKPAVLGISMGGMIAQQLAIRHPEKVSKLILINTAIAGHQSVHPSADMEKKLLSLPRHQLGFYKVAVNCFFPSTWKNRMSYELITDRFLPRYLHPVNLRQIVPIQKKLLMDWSQDDKTALKLKKLRMPVLILCGEEDQVLPPANSRILARAIPNATLKCFKEGGHAMIYQYPQELAEIIDEFCTKSVDILHREPKIEII